MFFVTVDGAYYEGDTAHPTDRSVPQRPSPVSRWNSEFEVWEDDPDLKAAADAIAAAEAATVAFVSSPEVQSLVTLGPDDVDAFVDAHVTDLDGAKTLLKLISKAVLLVAHKVL